MSTYPAVVDTFPTHTNWTGDPDTAPDTALLTAADVNNVQAAVVAVEGELGVDPAGASATVAARLDTADTTVAGKADKTTAIAAGTGLTGGGTLAADRTLTVAYGTTGGTAAQGNDGRLSDARTPTAHAATHAAAGSDAVTVTQAQVTDLTTDLAGKAPLASPALTGTPTVPTAATGTNTTQAASTAYALAAGNTAAALAIIGI